MKVGRLTRVRESELLALIKVDCDVQKVAQLQLETRREHDVVYSVFGLIDPRSQRVFYVGYTDDAQPQLSGLPDMVASRIDELSPVTPQIVILETVESRPEVCLVKWSKRFRRDLVTSDWKRQKRIANAFTNSKRARRVLGEEVSSDATMHADFHAYDRAHPEVFEEMLHRARSLRDEGLPTIGVDLLACEIRYGLIGTSRLGGFKIPNNSQAFYARKLQMVDDSLCGLFSLIHSVADDLVLEDGRAWRDFAREHANSIRYEKSVVQEVAQ